MASTPHYQETHATKPGMITFFDFIGPINQPGTEGQLYSAAFTKIYTLHNLPMALDKFS